MNYFKYNQFWGHCLSPVGGGRPVWFWWLEIM